MSTTTPLLVLESGVGNDELDQLLSNLIEIDDRPIPVEEVDEEPITNVEQQLLMVIDFDGGDDGDSFMIDAFDYNTLLEELAVDDDMGLSGSPQAAAKSVVENLPLVHMRKYEDFGVCAICGDEIEEGEIVNKLPCCHYYHGDCIVPWLRMRNTCPMCRYELPTDNEEYESRRRLRDAREVSRDSSTRIELCW